MCFLSMQNTLAVDHCGDYDFVLFDAIDDPIAVDQQLANVLVVELWHLPSRTRKARQSPGLIHNLLTTMPA